MVGREHEVKIEVSWEDVHDNLAILGAARPLFEEMAEKDDTPGIFRVLLKNWAVRAGELTTTLSAAANEASTPVKRTRRTKAELAGADRSRVRSGARSA